MNETQLILRYIPDDEYLGEVVATVQSRGYSGEAKARFDKTDLKERFITSLRHYPLAMDHLPVVESGFGSKSEPGRLDQCHVRIAIRPYNSQGLLLVQTDLATEVWSTPDEDCQQLVTTRFVTEYSLISVFADELELVLDEKRERAVLTGRPG